MPQAYHSSFNESSFKTCCSCALLPLFAKNSKGPAPRPDPDCEKDVIDECLRFFKANVFFTNYEIKGDADRTLVYLTLFCQQAVGRITRCISKDDVKKEMYQLAIEPFVLPGDGGFPLNSMYSKPTSKRESDELRAYLVQCRHELGGRLAELVCDPETGKVSKWWTCFAKRKFMGKSLEGPGKR